LIYSAKIGVRNCQLGRRLADRIGLFFSLRNWDDPYIAYIFLSLKSIAHGVLVGAHFLAINAHYGFGVLIGNVYKFGGILDGVSLVFDFDELMSLLIGNFDVFSCHIIKLINEGTSPVRAATQILVFYAS
jgi:hypothetical protein